MFVQKRNNHLLIDLAARKNWHVLHMPLAKVVVVVKMRIGLNGITLTTKPSNKEFKGVLHSKKLQLSDMFIKKMFN